MDFYTKLPNTLPNGDKIVDFVALAQKRLPDIHGIKVGPTGQMDIVLKREDHGIATLNRVTVRFFDPAESPHQKLSDEQRANRQWQLVGVYQVPTVDGKKAVAHAQAQEAVQKALQANANTAPDTEAPKANTAHKAKKKGAPKGGWPKKSAPQGLANSGDAGG